MKQNKASDKKSQNTILPSDKIARATLIEDLRETVLAVALLAKFSKRDGTRLKSVAKSDVAQILRLIDQKRLAVKTDRTQCTVSLEIGKSPNITKISAQILAHRLNDFLVQSREASKEIAVFIERACACLNSVISENILRRVTAKDIQIVVDELRSKARTFDLLVKDASIHSK